MDRPKIDQHVRALIPLISKNYVAHHDNTGNHHYYRVDGKGELSLCTGTRSRQMSDLAREAIAELQWEPPVEISRKAIAQWEANPPMLAGDPTVLGFLGDDRPTFCRLPWRPGDLQRAPHPAWDEWDARLSDADAFHQAFWSLFELKSKDRRAVYLWGEGEDGKSQVFKALQSLLNSSWGEVNSKSMESPHFGADLHGKRMCYVKENKNASILRTGIIHELTGGDNLYVNPKFVPAFHAPNHVKVWVAANALPEIGHARADQSRLLLIQVAPSKNTDDPTWINRLIAELPAYLAHCRDVYRELCPHHGKFQLNDRSEAVIMEMSDNTSEEWDNLIQSLFVIDPNGKVQGQHFDDALKAHKMNGRERKDFKKYMAQRGIIPRAASKSNGCNFHRGIRLRTTNDTEHTGINPLVDQAMLLAQHKKMPEYNALNNWGKEAYENILRHEGTAGIHLKFKSLLKQYPLELKLTTFRPEATTV